MRLNLNGVRIKGEPQAFFHHFLGKGFPIFFRVSDGVGIVITHGTVHFGQNRYRFNRFDCAFETHRYVGPFFTDCGRRGCLSVGTGQHRNFGPAMGVFHQSLMDTAQERNELLTTFGEHQSVRSVVDVFTGAAEMDKFAGTG